MYLISTVICKPNVTFLVLGPCTSLSVCGEVQFKWTSSDNNMAMARVMVMFIAWPWLAIQLKEMVTHAEGIIERFSGPWRVTSTGLILVTLIQVKLRFPPPYQNSWI